MATRVENSNQCSNYESIEVVCKMIGATFFVFNIQVEFLQIYRPLLMGIVQRIRLCLYKLKRPVINVDDRLFPQNVILLLLARLYDGIHLFIIGVVLFNCIGKCLTMVGHWILVLGEDYTKSIVRGLFINFKWLLQLWKCEYYSIAEAMLQLNEQFLLGLRPKKLCFHSALGNLTQRPSDMGESQHEPLIKICKVQKSVKLH